MKLTTLVLVLNDVAIAAVIPVLAESFALDNARWLKISVVVSKSLYLIGGFFGLLFFLSPQDILSLVYGNGGFVGAADVMRVFGVVLVVRFGMETYAMMLTTANKQRFRMVVVILATLINVIANIFAIPRYGILGAAFVSLGTNAFIAVTYFALVSIQTGRWFPLMDAGQLAIILGFVLSGAVLWAFGISSLALVVPIVLILTVALTFLGFSKQENEIVLSFLRIRASR